MSNSISQYEKAAQLELERRLRELEQRQHFSSDTWEKMELFRREKAAVEAMRKALTEDDHEKET